MTLPRPGKRCCGPRAGVWVLAWAGAVAAAYGLVIRPWHLRWGATREEAARGMPGDDVVSHPQLEATRAITIAAPPEAVWPWLMQMGGYTRAGWYSYDRIDNAGRTSDWEIRPDLQDLAVGDVMATTPDGRGFEVRAIDPQRSLVLAIDAPKAAITTALTLEPVEPDATRLVIRLRQRAPTWRGWPFLAAMDAGDFVMMRRMLLGIRDRAERAYRRDRTVTTAV
jgi:uncharacterized protein YndB with AHSA1/START domain